MQSEAPLTLILSPLRAGRGELERTLLGSLFGEADRVPPKVPISLSERERVRVRVRLDCMDTAKERQAQIPLTA
jgi:hypothetical protein